MGAEDKFTEAANALGKGYLSNQYSSTAGREAFLRDQHQKVLSGNPSLMKTNSVSSDPDNSDKEKKKKERDAFNRLRLKLQLDQMLDTMNGILNEMRDNDRKIRMGLRVLKDKDLDEARLFLMDQCGKTSEELETKSGKELLEMVAEETGIVVMKQKELKQQLKDLAEEYKTKANDIEDPELTQQYLDKLEKLEQEARQFEGVDYEKAFKEVLEEGNYEYRLLVRGDSNLGDLEQKDADLATKTPVVSELIELDENLEDVVIGKKGVLSEKFTASSQPNQDIATTNKKVINELDALNDEMDKDSVSTPLIKTSINNMG